MNTWQFLKYNCSISWRMQRNELPLKIFLATFAIRIIFQSLFFVWVANIIGGEQMRNFALYGNILIPAVHILLIDVYNVLKDEIDEQRMDLLSISKASLLSILVGRSMVYFFKGFFIILFTYAVIGLFLIRGVEPWILFTSAIPLLLIFTLSAYALGIFLASLNLNSHISQMLPNIAVALLILLGNFTIPINVFPKLLQNISHYLPLSHAVTAFRAYMVEGIPYWTNSNFYLEIPILIVYLVIGYSIYIQSVKKLRKHPIK